MLKNIFKHIALIIIIIIISIAFTGTHIVHSVDDLAYAVGLGIDVGDTKALKVTFQFTMPNSSGESTSGETAPSVIDSVEADSVDAAINLMNAYVSKEINLSHCEVIVISEELAKKGIGKEIYTLMNKVQIRPDNSIIISICSANEYLKSVSPSLENLVAKFYEILPESSSYTGYTIDAELGKFFNNIVCEVYQPTAILGNAILEESNSDKNSGDSESNPNSEPISAKNGIENIGMAVFKEDKMVGTLTSEETLAHLIFTNKLKSCNFTISDPENKDKKIDLYLNLNRAPTVDASIVNGTPYITTTTLINARIASVDSITDKTSENRLTEIEKAASNQLKDLLENYLYKTSKEFHSDIAGFGKYVLKKFKTMTDYQNYNWLNHYQDAFFKTNVTVSIESGFLLTGN